MEEEEGKRKEVAEEIIRDLGIEVEVRDVKRLGGDKEKKRDGDGQAG